MNNAQIINSYDAFMPCLHRLDVLFSESQKSKTIPPSSTKMPASEAAIQVSKVVGGHNFFLQSRQPSFLLICSKPGHSIEACWMKHPEKKKTFLAKGRDPSQKNYPTTT